MADEYATLGQNFVSAEPRVAAQNAAETTPRINELWDKVMAQVEGYTPDLSHRDDRDAWDAAERMRRRVATEEEKQSAVVSQLARDLLLALVRRGDQQIDPAGIWQVARDFVAAGE